MDIVEVKIISYIDSSGQYTENSAYSLFEGCSSLVNAPVIPSSVTNVISTFYGCTNLTTLNLKGSDNVTVLDVTDVGSEKGSFTVTSTIGTTTATTVPNSTGWDSSYMVSKEE